MKDSHPEKNLWIISWVFPKLYIILPTFFQFPQMHFYSQLYSQHLPEFCWFTCIEQFLSLHLSIQILSVAERMSLHPLPALHILVNLWKTLLIKSSLLVLTALAGKPAWRNKEFSTLMPVEVQPPFQCCQQSPRVQNNKKSTPKEQRKCDTV